MSRLRVMVGAAAEASMSAVFRPLIQAGAMARARVTADMRSAGQAIARGMTAAVAGAYGQLRSVAERFTSEYEAQAARRVRADRSAAAQTTSIYRRAYREQESAAQSMARSMLRDERGRFVGRGGAGGGSIARDAVATMGGFARTGARVAANVAQGAGVNLDFSHYVGTGVELEKRAVDLTNSAYLPNGDDPDAKTARDPKALMSHVMDVGDRTATDFLAAMRGLQDFVGKTGDLKTGELVLERMARLARATASGLDDMVSASGAVANAIGDVGDKSVKAAKIDEVMRALAGQGKLGAVEISDLAKEFDKLGSAGGKFKFEGMSDVDSRVRSLKTMGALAQIARASGGAWNATIAANSVSGLVNTLSTPARIKAMKSQGIDPYKDGFLQDPMGLIKSALVASGGDRETFKKMFQNVMGERAVGGFMQTFLDNGGATGDPEKVKKALAKIDDQFSRIYEAEMTTEQVDAQFSRSMGTTEAKVQQFNNTLDRLSGDVAAKVLPSLERLAPKIISLIEAFNTILVWAVDNPGKAITAAIVASIAKAAIASAVTSGVESLMRTAVTAGATSLGSMAKSGLVGLSIATAAVTVGTLILDELQKEEQKGAADYGTADAERNLAIGKYNAEMRLDGKASSETMERLKKAQGGIEDRIRHGEAPTSFFDAINPWGDKTMRDYGHDQKAADDLPSLKADLEAIKVAINNQKNGVQKVMIIGGPVPGPVVDSAGRAGPNK